MGFEFGQGKRFVEGEMRPGQPGSDLCIFPGVGGAQHQNHQGIGAKCPELRHDFQAGHSREVIGDERDVDGPLIDQGQRPIAGTGANDPIALDRQAPGELGLGVGIGLDNENAAGTLRGCLRSLLGRRSIVRGAQGGLVRGGDGHEER